MRGTGSVAIGLFVASVAEAAPISVSPKDAQAKLAVLIGVTEFDDRGWPTLRFSARDAESLASELQRTGEFSTVVMTGEKTARADVMARLDDLERRNTSALDTVVVYVSTHGTLAPSRASGLEQVLVLRDTQKDDLLGTGLLLRDIFVRFNALKSEKKVLVLATCYSGAGKSAFADATASYLAGLKGPPLVPLIDVSHATAVLSASSAFETAREDERLGHDIYTHYFIEALRGYDPDQDGATSVTEAHEFARRQTYQFSGGNQRPSAIFRLVGDDPIILSGARLREARPTLLGYEPELAGYRVVVDGEEKGVLPGAVVLEPGSHEIVVTKGSGEDDVVFRDRINPRVGERIAILDVMQEEPRKKVTVGASFLALPGVDGGNTVRTLGGVELAFRLERRLFEAVDIVWLSHGAFGGDTWTVNQERIAVGYSLAAGRLGIGRHLDVGQMKLEFDAIVGGGVFVVSPSSPYFPGTTTTGLFVGGVSAHARYRWTRVFSVGAGFGVDGWLGAVQGVGGRGTISATLGF